MSRLIEKDHAHNAFAFYTFVIGIASGLTEEEMQNNMLYAMVGNMEIINTVTKRERDIIMQKTEEPQIGQRGLFTKPS